MILRGNFGERGGAGKGLAGEGSGGGLTVNESGGGEVIPFERGAEIRNKRLIEEVERRLDHLRALHLEVEELYESA